MFNLNRIKELERSIGDQAYNLSEIWREVNRLEAVLFSVIEEIPEVPKRYVLKKSTNASR